MPILAKDISRWQGAYSETGEPIVFVKISGGDQGLYIDPQAANNYNQVIAHGHAFAGYHFAGGGDPVAEANFFLNAMQPWNPGEVPCLDWEISHPDPVGWCLAFANQVHSVAGAWPLIYMNRATLMAYDWSPVLNNCALWLADWVGQPNPNIDTGKYTYTVLQYNDGPVYDRDVVYCDSVDQFKKLGWPSASVPVPTPVPQPAPAPEPAPEPSPAPAPVPEPTPEPAPLPSPDTPPETPPNPVTPPVVNGTGNNEPKPNILLAIWNWLLTLLRLKRNK